MLWALKHGKEDMESGFLAGQADRIRGLMPADAVSARQRIACCMIISALLCITNSTRVLLRSSEGGTHRSRLGTHLHSCHLAVRPFQVRLCARNIFNVAGSHAQFQRSRSVTVRRLHGRALRILVGNSYTSFKSNEDLL